VISLPTRIKRDNGRQAHHTPFGLPAADIPKEKFVCIAGRSDFTSGISETTDPSPQPLGFCWNVPLDASTKGIVRTKKMPLVEDKDRKEKKQKAGAEEKRGREDAQANKRATFMEASIRKLRRHTVPDA